MKTAASCPSSGPAGLSPYVAGYFVISAVGLWLFSVLLARSRWWRRAAAWVKVLAAVGSGFVATTWLIFLLDDWRFVDFTFLVLGGIGAAAGLVSLLYREIVEEGARCSPDTPLIELGC